MDKKMPELRLKQSICLVVLAAAIAPAGVFAQQTQNSAGSASSGMVETAGIPTPVSDSQPQAQGIPMGPMTVYPSLRYGIVSDDNIFLQSSGPLKKADTIQSVKASVLVEAKQAENVYSLNLIGDFGRYSSSTADNFNDYSSQGQANLRLGTSLAALLKLSYANLHDQRGSTNDPATATPNRYDLSYIGGVFTLGAKEAQGSFALELGEQKKNYYNNVAVTASNNYNTQDLGGTFGWRLSPKTQLIFEAKQSVLDYTQTGSTLDSTEMRYFIGATWEATAATTGAFKIGSISKDYKSSTRQDSSGVGWDARVVWSPLTYSKVALQSYQQPQESSGLGNSLTASKTLVNWTHDWNSRVTTTVAGAYGTEQYQGFPRTDHFSSLGLQANYQMRRWLTFGADYAYSQRDSNVPTAAYSRNVFLLFVKGSL